jgi:hypothetical protein
MVAPVMRNEHGTDQKRLPLVYRCRVGQTGTLLALAAAASGHSCSPHIMMQGSQLHPGISVELVGRGHSAETDWVCVRRLRIGVAFTSMLLLQRRAFL